MFFALFAIAIGTLVSEDLACVSAGILVAKHQSSFAAAILACLAGIVGGDILLYLAGRLAGTRLLQWRFVQRRLTTEKLERASEWLRSHGVRVVLASRFTPGMRLPIYVVAGALKVHAGQMILAFAMAAVLWVPLLVGASAWFGSQFVASALANFRLGAILLSSTIAAFLLVRNRHKLRWEFWPSWAIYLPVAPYIIYLGLKHRCLTLFTAANPGIYSGGLCGESKSAILDNLSSSGAVARFVCIPQGNNPAARMRAVSTFEYPLVLKPDVGERGEGVAVIRSLDQVRSYLEHHTEPLIAQEYVPGVEFGVFYARRPDEHRGRILSITEKRFPSITGDGRRNLRELIMADERASTIADTYLKNVDGTRVPAMGETVQLVELGSHCRGAIFLDGRRLLTSNLENRVDTVAHAHAGFFFGRFDIRATSVEAFQAGQFRVIELNGVAGEPAHIYDPSVSLIDAYRALYRHWALAFEIGAANRARGARPMAIGEILELVRVRRQLRLTVPASMEAIASGVR